MRPHIFQLKQDQEEQIVTAATKSLYKSLAFAHGDFRTARGQAESYKCACLPASIESVSEDIDEVW